MSIILAKTNHVSCTHNVAGTNAANLRYTPINLHPENFIHRADVFAV
jgi:hypothetical protein